MATQTLPETSVGTTDKNPGTKYVYSFGGGKADGNGKMKDDLGGYYTLGRIFVRLIEHPEIMRVCTRYGLPRPLVMKFVLKLLSDCYEPRGGDLVDRVISGLSRLAPAA